ncbi:MAG: hypothetical protein ACLS8Q_09835 [Anaerovoracaceae bacterium]
MEHSMTHEFFLVKVVEKGALLKDNFCNNVIHGNCLGDENKDYIEVSSTWFHNEFMEYIWLSLTDFTVKLNFTGLTVLEKRHDIVKLSRVCRGWILVFKEFPEKFEMGAWDDVFQRGDVIENLKKLESMSKKAIVHPDHIMLYAGI